MRQIRSKKPADTSKATQSSEFEMISHVAIERVWCFTWLGSEYYAVEGKQHGGDQASSPRLMIIAAQRQEILRRKFSLI